MAAIIEAVSELGYVLIVPRIFPKQLIKSIALQLARDNLDD